MAAVTRTTSINVDTSPSDTGAASIPRRTAGTVWFCHTQQTRPKDPLAAPSVAPSSTAHDTPRVMAATARHGSSAGSA